MHEWVCGLVHACVVAGETRSGKARQAKAKHNATHHSGLYWVGYLLSPHLLAFRNIFLFAPVEATRIEGRRAPGTMPGAPASNVPDSRPVELGLNWRFLQCFGERVEEEEVQEADIISALEFDSSGEYLATGDRGGRVVLFENQPSPPMIVGSNRRPRASRAETQVEFRYLTEFQSHLPEFDYLKSLEVEEKINCVRWCRSHPTFPHMLLSANDKTIKLWRVSDKKIHHMGKFNQRGGDLIGTEVASPSSSPPPTPVKDLGLDYSMRLRMPEILRTEHVLSPNCARVFGNAHAYHINSISTNSDGETFLSADDLRVLLWNLEIQHTSFNIVDIKPENMEDLSEVITSCEFHPYHCNIFGYSTCKGCVRLVDMRMSARYEGSARVLEAPQPVCSLPMFSEVLSSITDMRFGWDGHTIMTRDFMTLKRWDLRMEDAPLSVFSVHDQLQSKLYELYENDCIFDKFRCGMNGTGSHMVTGTYNNMFRIFGIDGTDQWLESSRNPIQQQKSSSSQVSSRGQREPMMASLVNSVQNVEDHSELANHMGGEEHLTLDGAKVDWDSKLLQVAWHPIDNVVAIGASNSLFLFNAP